MRSCAPSSHRSTTADREQSSSVIARSTAKCRHVLHCVRSSQRSSSTKPAARATRTTRRRSPSGARSVTAGLDGVGASLRGTRTRCAAFPWMTDYRIAAPVDHHVHDAVTFLSSTSVTPAIGHAVDGSLSTKLTVACWGIVAQGHRPCTDIPECDRSWPRLVRQPRPHPRSPSPNSSNAPPMRSARSTSMATGCPTEHAVELLSVPFPTCNRTSPHPPSD